MKIILLIISLSLISCSSQIEVTGQESFEEMIHAISSSDKFYSLMDESTFSAIYNNPYYKAIYKKPKSFEADAREFIKNKSTEVETKKIAVYTMQCLSSPDYLSFVKFLFNEVRHDNIETDILSAALYPGADFGFGLAVKYNDKDVQFLLDEIQNSSKGKLFEKKIKSILSGEYKEFIDYLRSDEGRNIPSVPC